MQHTTTIRRVGNSLGVILPKNLLADDGLDEGESVLVTVQPAPPAEDFYAAWAAVKKKHRTALRRLAQR